MSEYTAKINGRIEYLLICDTCNLKTTSLEHKEMLMKPIICPMCRKPISRDSKGQISENEFRSDF